MMVRSTELSAGLALAWSLLLTLGLVSVAIVVGVLFGSSNWAIVVAGPLELVLVLPAAAFIARLYGQGDLRQALALGSATPAQLLLATVLGVLLHLPSGYLSELVERRFPTPPQKLLAELAALTPSSAVMAALMLLSVAAIVPLAEEAYFRGALFTALGRHQPAFVAIWTTSIAFALAHQEPRNWAPLLLIALVLGELRRSALSIWPGVALHASFNATTLLVVFVTRPVEVKPQASSALLSLFGLALCGAGVWLFGRVSRRALIEERR